MFSSDGSDKLKTGLDGNWRVLSVIVAALVVAALMLFLLQPKDPELPLYKPDDAKTAGYQADATNCSPDALAAIGDVRKRTAQRNGCADKAEDHRLKTDDLIQQTRAADAARAQAISAGYQSWLALWATVGGFLTLIAAGLAAAYARDAAKEGKRSADAAHDALVEAKSANKIAIKAARNTDRQSSEANRFARKSAERQIRAYIGVEKVQPIRKNLDHMSFSVLIQNFGASPAQDVHYAAMITTESSASHADLDWQHITKQILSPTQPWGLPVSDGVDDSAFFEGTRILLLEIRYEDVFGNQWSLCQRFVSADADEWHTDGTGNYERRIGTSGRTFRQYALKDHSARLAGAGPFL